MSRSLVLATALLGAALAAALVAPAPGPAPGPHAAPELGARETRLLLADEAPPLPGDEPVCCLIDTPAGCTGCGKGESCVYQTMSAHQCVLVVYGTRCDDRYCAKGKP